MQSRRLYKAGKFGSYHRNSSHYCKDISHFQAKFYLNGNSYKHLILCMQYRVLNSLSISNHDKKNSLMHTLNNNNYKKQYYNYTLNSQFYMARNNRHSLNNNLNYMLSIWYYHSCCSQHSKFHYTAYKYLKRCQVCSTGIFCFNSGMIHVNHILCKHQHRYIQYRRRHKLCKYRFKDKSQFNIVCTRHYHI